MEVERLLRDPFSRRRFFRASGVTFVGGSAVFLAACGGGSHSGSTQAGTSGNADVDVLNAALDLEHTVIAAYSAGLPLLRGRTHTYGTQFLAQERLHARGLEQAIKDLSGVPIKPRPASAYAAQLPKLRGQSDVLMLAKDLESTVIAAYIDAIPKLSDGQLRGTVAAIVTDEAEHLSVLLGALGSPLVAQAPDPFVTGRKT
jgi:hypothetical protein